MLSYNYNGFSLLKVYWKYSINPCRFIWFKRIIRPFNLVRSSYLRCHIPVSPEIGSCKRFHFGALCLWADLASSQSFKWLDLFALCFSFSNQSFFEFPRNCVELACMGFSHLHYQVFLRKFLRKITFTVYFSSSAQI